MHVATDGTVEVVWTGLTTVVDVAVGADGTLYALELSTGNSAEAPLNPGTGRIVRQTGPDTAEAVHEGLMFPIAMEIGADGAFYVSTPAIGANDGSGAIVRLEAAMTDGSAPPAASRRPAGSRGSRRVHPDRGHHRHDASSSGLGSSGIGAGVGAGIGAGVRAGIGSGVGAGTDATVTIDDFAFGPAELSVAAGTTVTFVNNDTAPHTATADDESWDTGEIAAGASATVTFDDAPARSPTTATSTRT